MNEQGEQVDIIDLFSERGGEQLRQAGTVLYAADVYVKCWAWDVTLPIAADPLGDLDIFELTALQFANLHRMTLVEMADETCLAEDFLKTIVARLVDRGYLTANAGAIVITEEGRDHLGQKSESSTTQEFVRLLMLPETGQLLPLIVSEGDGEKREDHVRQYGILQGRMLTVVTGKNSGEAEARRYPAWVPHKSKAAKACRESLTGGCLRQFIRAYNMSHASGRRKLDLKRKIDVSPSPSTIYLHAIVLLQRGLVGIPLVADSDAGNDQMLAVYARQYQNETLAAIRQRADAGAARRKQDDGEGGPKYRRYRDIHALMEPLEAPEAEMAEKEVDMTEDAKRQYRRRKEEGLKKAYRAVELALSYYLQIYPLKDARRHALQAMTLAENRQYLAALAAKIGFRVDHHGGELAMQRLFGQLDSSRIRVYYAKRIANLYTVLPLALASTGDRTDGTLWQVAREQPKLLAVLARLTQSSQFRHGSAEGTPEDNEAYREYPTLIAAVKRFLDLLLPGYREDTTDAAELAELTGSAVGTDGRGTSDASSRLLHAEDMAVSLLGPDVYSRLNRNMQDDVLAVTEKYNDIDLAPVDFISNLAKILENLYRGEVGAREHLKRKTRAEISAYIEAELGGKGDIGSTGNLDDGDSADSADSGNPGERWHLPVALATVHDAKIAAAARDENASLGAYALVYFGNLEPAELEGAKEDLACTAEILQYRRHDNNLQLQLSQKKLKALREAVFSQVKRRYQRQG